MRVAEVAVTIDREGKVELQVRGIPGPGCEQLTAGVERRLGGTVSRRHTAEYDRLDPAQPATVGVRTFAMPETG